MQCTNILFGTPPAARKPSGIAGTNKPKIAEAHLNVICPRREKIPNSGQSTAR